MLQVTTLQKTKTKNLVRFQDGIVLGSSGTPFKKIVTPTTNDGTLTILIIVG